MHESVFGYMKYSSVTNMLLELGLPTFNTVKVKFYDKLKLYSQDSVIPENDNLEGTTNPIWKPKCIHLSPGWESRDKYVDANTVIQRYDFFILHGTNRF